jgi:hypothetical protein
VYNECCRVDKAPQQLSESPLQQELRQQIQLWVPRIGLERQVIKAIHKKDVARRREQLLDIVGESNLQKYNFSSSNSQSEQDERAELTRAKCQDISRPGTLFALHIGIAQAP